MIHPALVVGVMTPELAYWLWELWLAPVLIGRAMIAQATRLEKVLPVARMDNIDAMKAGALLGRV